MFIISLFEYSTGFIITISRLVTGSFYSHHPNYYWYFSLGLPNYSPSVKPLTKMNERVYVSMQKMV